MKVPGFNSLLSQLASLNQSQRQQVLAVLNPAAGLSVQLPGVAMGT